MVNGRVRQVVVLHSNDWIGLAWADSALVVLGEWLSYRGGRTSRFGCNKWTTNKNEEVVFFPTEMVYT